MMVFSKMFFNSSLAKRLLRAMFVALTVPGLLIAVEVKPLQDKAPMILVIGPGACVLTKEGDLYCWGRSSLHVDKNGELKYLNSLEPTYVGKTKDGKRVKFVYMKSGYSGGLILLTAKGEVYSYGAGYGEGSVRFVEKLNPSPTESDIEFVRVTLGDEHGCGLTKEGKAYCWGYHLYLGHENLDRDYSSGDMLGDYPDMYAGYPNANIDVSGYDYHSNYASTPAYILYPSPVKQGYVRDGEDIKFEEDIRFVDIKARYDNTYAEGVDGSFYIWGNYSGGFYKRKPSILDGPLNNDVRHLKIIADRGLFKKAIIGEAMITDTGEEVWFEKVLGDEDPDYGEGAACGLTKEGKAYCWNLSDDYNDKEKKLGRILGYGGVEGKNRPVAVAPSEAGEELRFNQIYRFRGLTCGATLDSRFYCWGHVDGIFGEDFKREPITYKDRYDNTETSTGVQLVPKEIKIGK